MFGVVNKIFLSYEAAFLHPDIAEIITLWSQVDETAVPMEERWYRKIYSFCKGNQATKLPLPPVISLLTCSSVQCPTPC